MSEFKSVNPIAARLSEASVLMEDTTHPELSDMLRIGANEIDRLQRLVARADMARAVEIDRMVNLFLAWPLPDSVCSDLCVTDAKYHEKWQHKRSGTNLLTEAEARQMIAHVVAS